MLERRYDQTTLAIVESRKVEDIKVTSEVANNPQPFSPIRSAFSRLLIKIKALRIQWAKINSITQGLILTIIISSAVIVVLGILPNKQIISQQSLNIILGIALACIALLIFIVPILNFVVEGQECKRERILTYYTPELMRMYFLHWRQHRLTQEGKMVDLKECEFREDSVVINEFEAMLKSFFGEKIFALPLILLSAVSTVALSIACSGGLTIASRIEYHPWGLKLDVVSIAAIAGSYTWVTWDAVTKCHQEWLQPSDLLWYAGRFVIAVPIGHAIAVYAATDAQPASVGWGAAAAFIAGMFSWEAIMARLDALSSRILKIAEAPDEKDDLVISLPGIDKDTSNKLKTEAITTITQLANADPIRLSLITNMSIGYILEMVDVAVLFKCGKETVVKLAKIGWTRASDVIINPLPSSKEEIDALKEQVKIEDIDINRIAEQLKLDPRVKFIAKARHLQL